ncbi:MAG TPA: hypothetical protein VNL92_00745 [Dehalococcoidia bacterium]|nr:hypothetical protein [Dehalococcoidia bacterium]
MFANGKPVLVVRARVDDAVMAEFRRWHFTIHLPHMLAIPGVVGGQIVKRNHERTPPINWQTIFEFSANSELQSALQSPQAQRAREDWAVWADYVSDLSIEVYAELSALPAFHHWN